MARAKTIAAAVLMVTACVHPAAADDFDAPPIRYSASTPDNPISRLQARLDAGKSKLTYDDHFGYLRALLDELKVPHSSQMLVFSKTSLQRQRIAPATPRSLYFNDDAYVGFCQAGDVLEISAVDPQLGTVYYTLDQTETASPKFIRQTDNCTICHASSNTRGVPGHLVRSVFSDAAGYPILASGTFRTDHTSPLKDRWGGWYVTGTHGSQPHLGNRTYRRGTAEEVAADRSGHNLMKLDGKLEVGDFLTPHSDIVALMVLEHQTEGHNRIVRAAFETRQALHHETELNRELEEPAGKRWESTTSRIRAACEPLVEYLLMCEEAPLEGPIAGTSGFDKEFAANGPRDSRGRSLRDLDLRRRLFRYPLSYLVYSEAFDALPAEANAYVGRRITEILSGEDRSPSFAHLSGDDRRAILEIVRETKADLLAERPAK
jgi:hypothetical protein